MRHLIRLLCAASVIAIPLLGSVAGADMESQGGAEYTVTFVPTWNPATHPADYPVSHARGGLLTPMIGATHPEGFAIFAPGEKPSAGLENLSETGSQEPLDAEIEDAVASGAAGSLIRLSMGSDGPVHAPVSHTFRIDESAPLVSLVGMIAPSPDWFYGVSGVRLYDKGRWLNQVTVDVFAWDSGGDAGTTYMAPDMDLERKQPTTYVETAHFKQSGELVPVGVFVFSRVPQNQ